MSQVWLPSRRDLLRGGKLSSVPLQEEWSLVPQVQRHAQILESARDHELYAAASALRESLTNCGANSDEHETQLLVLGTALVREAVRRACGLTYYDEQLLAGMAAANGRLLEMATGEGKTIVSAIPAFFGWLRSQQVHVTTCNRYLAQRDFERLRPAFELLGLKCSLLIERSDSGVNRSTYFADVVYGTGEQFGLDFLRQQSSRSNRGRETSSDAIPRFQQAVIDEADTVLVDQAQTLLQLYEPPTSARIARQRFYREYSALCGLTATALESEREFAEFYQLRVLRIPRHAPKRRVDLPDRYFSSRDAKLRAIVGEVLERHRCGQPVLIGTANLGDGEILSDFLRSLRVSHVMLSGQQTAREAELVARAGEYRAITIATNMAGRGTDIVPDDRALAVGGLFVIGAERQFSRRADRQLAGRSGRHGNFGFSRFFVSGDDDLIVQYAPRLGKRLQRSADRNGEVHDNYAPLVAQFQVLAENENWKLRRKLAEHDERLDRVMAELVHDSFNAP